MTNVWCTQGIDVYVNEAIFERDGLVQDCSNPNGVTAVLHQAIDIMINNIFFGGSVNAIPAPFFDVVFNLPEWRHHWVEYIGIDAFDITYLTLRCWMV